MSDRGDRGDMGELSELPDGSDTSDGSGQNAWSAIEAAHIAADAASRSPDVVSLDNGSVGEVATYGSGQRVGGVVIRGATPRHINMQVVARLGKPLQEVATELRAAVRQQLAQRWPDAGSWQIDVHISDVSDGPDVPNAASGTGAGAPPTGDHIRVEETF